MFDIKDLQRFGKRNEEVQQNQSKDVWCYTRVSTKDQQTNFSLENQLEAAKRFALKNGYNLVKTFGSKNESAKDDFSRKEFTRLLAEVKKEKEKPFAIIVFMIDRFSRSGGHSITLASELIDVQGVHLIEIVSGIDTTTSKGRNELNQRLLAAEKETINKLERTVPGMKTFVRRGNWLGMAPKGYKQYGRRVKDFERLRENQSIVLNETGTLLRQAWDWKLKGEADYIIVKKLKSLGVKIDNKRLGEMWHNPFYCGYIAHKMLDGEVIKGNHEPMVSVETFMKVNGLAGKRLHEYETHKNCPERPLNGDIYCPICRKPLCGYYVAKKRLHYYKCQTCKGISFNADTSRRFKDKIGAHQLFINLLDSFEMDPIHIEAFKKQVKKMLCTNREIAQKDVAVFKRQLTELENKKEMLQERYAIEGLEQSLYLKFLAKLDDQIAELKQKYEEPLIQIPNLDSSLDKAIDFTQNISKYWQSTTLETKRKIQKLVFPDGLVLETHDRRYLTSKMNGLFAEKQVFVSVSVGDKKKDSRQNDENPEEVAGTGFEPMTFGL